jgi:hypothetical protein
MAPKIPDVFEPARQIAEQMTERTQETITNYFGWLQKAMQASPWGNTDLNKKLMSYATETVTAPLSLAQKLSQAKNLEDVVTIQTEFVRAQTNAFNKHAAERRDIQQSGDRCDEDASRHDYITRADFDTTSGS